MNPVTLDPEEQHELKKISGSAPEAIARRARLILAYSDGMQTSEAAQTAGLSPGRARYWKREYIRKGLAIFATNYRMAEEETPDLGRLTENIPQVREQTLAVKSEVEPASSKKKQRKEKHQAKKEKKYEFPVLAFPDPVKSPGLYPEDTLAEAGKKIFLVQFAEMLQHEGGTRLGEDIEALHDMRVATRRMRAAFDVFGDAFLPKIMKHFLSGLRQTGRLLGNVRDLDVFMEKGNRYLASLPDDAQQGLKPLLLAWQNQLGEARGKLIYHLDSQAYADFKLGFNYFVQTPGFGSKAINQDAPIPTRLCEIVPCLVYSRLAEVRAYGPTVNLATIPQLHALRIEFKKLRYALEYFIEVLGSETRQIIDLIKKLQDHLGDLHDADVACQILNNFLENWDRGQIGLQLTERQNPEPIVNYLAFQHAERHRLLVTFPEAWEKFEQPEIRRDLALVVSVL